MLAVISVGKNNPLGHPIGEVLERLEKKLDKKYIYSTDELGTIEFFTDGERLLVRKQVKTGYNTSHHLRLQRGE